jgi:nucleoside-diphosphate-sugar epimerase
MVQKILDPFMRKPVLVNRSRPTQHPKVLRKCFASKGAAEMLCHSYHYLYEMDITILRYFTVYGPAGRPDMSIFRFIQWISEERPVIVYGDGHQERDFTFVEDIARGTVAGLKPLGFEIINLGSDQPVELLDVIHRIEERVGKKASIDYKDEAPADVRATWANIRKANETLHWEPETDLENGLNESVEWYMKHRAWTSLVHTLDG